MSGHRGLKWRVLSFEVTNRELLDFGKFNFFTVKWTLALRILQIILLFYAIYSSQNLYCSEGWSHQGNNNIDQSIARQVDERERSQLPDKNSCEQFPSSCNLITIY